MNEITSDYIASLSKQPMNTSLEAVRSLAVENNVPIISRGVEALLSFFIKTHKVSRILEIGSAVGYSACLFASLMEDGGEVVTVERDENLYATALENIRLSGFEKKIVAVCREGEDFMAELMESGAKFDMVFMDGAKGQYEKMSQKAYVLLKTGGLMICDDVLFRGMVSGELPIVRRKITIVKRLRRFLNSLMGDERWQSVVLPVGDGVSVSVKL